MQVSPYSEIVKTLGIPQKQFDRMMESNAKGIPRKQYDRILELLSKTGRAKSPSRPSPKKERT